LNSKEKILDEKRRGECFRLLAACFYKPHKPVFVQEKVFQNLTSLLEQVCPDAAPFSKKMAESFLKCSEDELTIEYAKLFVGPYELKAPPYGSVYLDEGKRVWGDSTMEVAAMYKKAGLSIDDDFKELPDHISVEFEFMYYLIYKEIEALGKSEFGKASAFNEKQKVFLERFLKSWVPIFCSQLRDSTDNEFYVALANCVKCFLHPSQADQTYPVSP